MARTRVRYENPFFSALLFIIIMLGLFVTAVDPTGIVASYGVVITVRSLASINQAFLYIGVIMVLSGILIRIIAIVTLGRNFSGALRIREGHTLVRTGIYRWVRHPAYLGLILLFLGIPVMLSSIFGFLSMLLLAVFIVLRIKQEEKMLLARFGEEYKGYMEQSKKLIPFIY